MKLNLHFRFFLRFSWLVIVGLCTVESQASINCHTYIDLQCGYTANYDTKFGHKNNHDYSCFDHDLTGFHAKEIIYYIDRSDIEYAHDLEITVSDKFNAGLDAFIMENCGEFDARCYSYKENFGSSYKFTIKDANPHKKYYLIIDAKSITGAFKVSTFCRKKDFKCSAAIDLPCGETTFGNTHDGHANYSDYTCFDHDQFGYYAKELVYKITGRNASIAEDIEITLEDLDSRGLDIFILENCGKSDNRCLQYKERDGSGPKKVTLTIFNAKPHKDYYIIIDAKNSSLTGRFNLSAFCKRDQFFCHDAKDIPCGHTKFGNTHEGKANYHDYSCFKSSLTDFHAKELVYRITDRPDVHHDIEITIDDLDRRGLDMFVVENCGEENYRCFAHKIRTSSSSQKDKLLLYNTDPHKDYYIIIDAQSITGRFNLSIFCHEEGLLCEDAEDIFCGQSKDGNSSSNSMDYSDLSCFHPDFSDLPVGGVIYEVGNRPDNFHDLTIQINDKDQVGLDLFVFENCGDADAKCLTYFLRGETDHRREQFIVPNTDPSKTYHVLVTNSDGEHGDFRLTVLCEDEPSCVAACFHYLSRGSGNFDFYFPPDMLSGQDPHRWRFQNVISGESFFEEGRDLFNYDLSGGLLYRVSIVNEFDEEICYLLVQVGDCNSGMTEARAPIVEIGNCSLDFPSSSCSYSLDASSSIGSDLIYHWFLRYQNSSLDKEITTFRPDTTIGVAFPDSLLSICLVVTSSCGMSSYCWLGECGYTVDPYFEITEESENEVILNLLNRSVPCTSSVSIVTIDWGDGNSDDYDLHGAWDQIETYPRHSYEHGGQYYITIRIPYRCNELSGDFDTRSCVICISGAIRVGRLEDDNNCNYIDAFPGEFFEFTREYTLDYNFTPPGYEFSHFILISVVEGIPIERTVTETVQLEYGQTYEVGAVYHRIGDTDVIFKCTKPVFVEYPAEELVLSADDVCGTFGEVVDVPIRVSQFTEITGLQFRLDVVDKSRAQIMEVDFLNSDLPVSFGDILVDTTFNRLQFAWSAPQASEARSLAGESILFVLRVQITGMTSDTGLVDFSETFAFNNIKDLQIPVSTFPGSICIEANYSISGSILNENEIPLSDVTVFLNGPLPHVDSTDTQGDFKFENLGTGGYEVGAYLEDDFRRGVNVIDLALLKAYNRSFGEMGLTTPYQLLAANLRLQLDSRAISVADETELKRLISSDIDRLEEYETPWIFVTKDHEFIDPAKANLEDYPSSYLYDPLQSNHTEQDFIAVKIGDIDGSTLNVDPTGRSFEGLTIRLDTIGAEEGKEVRVHLRVDELINIQNLQFSIRWDPEILQYTGIDSTLADFMLDESSFSTRFVEEGVLTFVHSVAPNAVTISDTTLFSINFVAIGGEGSFSEVAITGDPVEILITDDKLSPQNVTTQTGFVNISMVTAAQDFQTSELTVGSHRPNPFTTQLQIPVVARKSEIIKMKVYDLVGHLIIARTVIVKPGEQIFTIEAASLPGAGQYFYELVSQYGTVARSFIYMH